jgi:hypothetical protein
MNEMALAMMQKGMRSKSMQKKIKANPIPSGSLAAPLLPLWGLHYVLFTGWDNNMLVSGIHACWLQTPS